MSDMRVAVMTVLVAISLVAVAGCGGSDDDAVDQAVKVPNGIPNIKGEKLKSCINDDTGLDAIGAPNAGAPDEPGFEVIATKGEGGPGAIIALYPKAATAAAALPEIGDQLKQTEAFLEKGAEAAEQRGAANVAWIPAPPADEARDAVLGCLAKL